MINAEATRRLALLSSRIDAHLIYVSTDYVFDGEKGLYKEYDVANPINYYGYTKLAGERFVRRDSKRWTIARTSVIYGWGGTKQNFATWLIKNLSLSKEVKVVTDQYVSPTLNVNLAGMLIEIAERGLIGIYHTAGAERVSRYDFAIELAEVFGLKKELIKKTTMAKIAWRAKRPKDSSLDITKAMTKLKEYKPMNLRQSLEVMSRLSSTKLIS